MATLLQLRLFGWRQIEAASDLDRFLLVVTTMPDERLMQFLESRRGRGRNDYPVRACWNAVLAGIVFQHASAASLLRELARNAELRELCGFEPAAGAAAVPTADTFERFLKLVVRHEAFVVAMFDELVTEIGRVLPDFGKRLAQDSKAVPSFGHRVRDERKLATPDGRRDLDADVGVKTYRGQHRDGTAWEKIVRWFGYKLHLVVDSTYELPVALEVTRASASDTHHLPTLVRELEHKQPELLERTDEYSADKAYDDEKNHRELHGRGIAPIIDVVRHWPKDEPTRPLYPNRVEPFVYDERGGVYCVCPASGELRELALHGYDRTRDALKYRCPAAALGLTCAGRAECERGRTCGTYGRVVWVPLADDVRRFCRIPRNTARWQTAYNRRSAIERVNSRVDNLLGFERHTIRGLAKMRTRLTLALAVMLAMALGRIRANQAEHMRSFVLPVARAA
jgi:hypothetical protein